MNYKREPGPPGKPPPPAFPRQNTTPPSAPTSSSNMKRERPRPPSPTPTVCTTVLSRPTPRAPSPAPSTSTTVAPIRVRPLSSLMDPDEQMSTVSSANPGLPSSSMRGDPLLLMQQVDECSNDWRCKKKSIVDRLKYVLENDNAYHDVIFEVGKEKIKAHQLILRISSPIFDRLLQETAESPGQPNSSQKEKVVPIPDIEPEIFRSLLKFIYTDEVSRRASDRRLFALLKASKLYGVIPLYEKCKRMLLKGICNEIAIDLYEFATFGMIDKDLMDFACIHIADNAFSIFSSEQFLRLGEENLGRLLDRDDLNIDELSVFLNVVRWAQSKCKERHILVSSANLRKVVDGIIHKIRFPLIVAEQMVLQVRRTNILTADEHVQIMDYICVKEPEKRKELPPIPFSTTPRRSRKNLILDYGKSPAEAGTSAITECIELVSSSSDPEESETASGVSGYSEGSKNPTKKKLKRAHSTSDAKKSKKRRRHSQADQFKDLFGDHEIALVNKEISLNEYVDHINTFDNLEKVERIVFDNVKISDLKNLNGRKIRFPNLRTFNMSIKTDESTKALLQDDDFKLEKIMFFSTDRDDCVYKDLFDTDVNVVIIINKVNFLKILPRVGHVTLNKFNGVPSILKSLRQESIKSLVYSHTVFNEKHFSLSLCRLVLLSSIANNINCMTDFLRHFSHLKELTIYPPASGSASESIPLIFDSKLKCQNKLRICGLRGFKLSIESSFKFRKMSALYLWNTSWDKTFEENFHTIFPFLEEGFFTMMNCSPKLLKNMLKISSLREIISWGVEWELTDSDVSDIRQRYKAPVSRAEKSFCLTKQEDGSWEYVKLNYESFQENVFRKFQYEFLYTDYQTFKTRS